VTLGQLLKASARISVQVSRNPENQRDAEFERQISALPDDAQLIVRMNVATHIAAHPVKKNTQNTLSLVIAVVFLFLLFGAAFYEPNPTPYQTSLFTTILALVGAGFGATIPGFLHVSAEGRGMAIRAGGALALFVLVYLVAPRTFFKPSVHHSEVSQGTSVSPKP